VVYHAARTGEVRNAYKIVSGKPEGKRPVGGPRGRRKENIKIDFKRDLVRRCELDSFALEKGSIAGRCEYGTGPSDSINGGIF
jgi:hypothetical protein